MSFQLPVIQSFGGVGAGSQPEEEGLEYMSLPHEMNTYRAPLLPEPEEIAHLAAARQVMSELQEALNNYEESKPCYVIPLNHLPAADLKLIAQILGDGEVKILCEGERRIHIQESVMAGIWQVKELTTDDQVTNASLYVGGIPELVQETITAGTRPALEQIEYPDNLMNAPSILTEIGSYQRECVAGGQVHVINLTLLPISQSDQDFLIEKLGSYPVTILSKGYGNCRISSANLRNVWWVRYYNSMDLMILNTIEIVDVPQVAKAAAEDIEDSAKRLRDILQDYLNWA